MSGKAIASTLCVAPGQLCRGISADRPATEETSTAVDLMTGKPRIISLALSHCFFSAIMADTMITTLVGQEGK